MELLTSEAFILALGALGLGIVMLVKGGDWTIDASIYVAKHLGVPPLLVGFTIIAFGTSLPELIVSLNAHVHGMPGIAIGNVLGSNIANILLVIGTTAVFTLLPVIPKAVRSDLIAMLLATVFLAGLLLYGEINRFTGVGMLALLVMYSIWKYSRARQTDTPVNELEEPPYKSMLIALLFLLLGLVFIAVGAEFLVRGARVSALVLGVPDVVIGLSIIAMGTSLPELSTCLIAAKKKQTDLIVGNIIGSNFFNIMMILGATAATKTIYISDIAEQLVKIDIWFTLGVSVLFAAILLIYRKINRIIGVMFLLAYTAYIITIYALYLTGT